jgi:hypothetical protein
MTAMRLNPPPDWPLAPPGWIPPRGWQPDPSWPDPPPGWPLWVEDTPASIPVQSRGPRWAMAGGAAILIGAFLPLISATANSGYLSFTENGRAKDTGAFFGIILIGIAVALHYWSAPSRFHPPTIRLLAIPLLALANFGLLGCGTLVVAGLAGFQEQTDSLGSVTVTYWPGIGLIVIFLGCLANTLGAIRTLIDQARPDL